MEQQKTTQQVIPKQKEEYPQQPQMKQQSLISKHNQTVSQQKNQLQSIDQFNRLIQNNFTHTQILQNLSKQNDNGTNFIFQTVEKKQQKKNYNNEDQIEERQFQHIIDKILQDKYIQALKKIQQKLQLHEKKHNVLLKKNKKQKDLQEKLRFLKIIVFKLTNKNDKFVEQLNKFFSHQQPSQEFLKCIFIYKNEELFTKILNIQEIQVENKFKKLNQNYKLAFNLFKNLIAKQLIQEKFSCFSNSIDFITIKCPKVQNQGQNAQKQLAALNITWFILFYEFMLHTNIDMLINTRFSFKIGNLYLSIHKYNEAIKYFNDGISMIQAMNSISLYPQCLKAQLKVVQILKKTCEYQNGLIYANNILNQCQKTRYLLNSNTNESQQKQQYKKMIQMTQIIILIHLHQIYKKIDKTKQSQIQILKAQKQFSNKNFHQSSFIMIQYLFYFGQALFFNGKFNKAKQTFIELYFINLLIKLMIFKL